MLGRVAIALVVIVVVAWMIGGLIGNRTRR